MEERTPDHTGFAASQSRTKAPSLLGPLKSATRMWCCYCTETVTFVFQVMSTSFVNLDLIQDSRIDDAPAVFPY